MSLSFHFDTALKTLFIKNYVTRARNTLGSVGFFFFSYIRTLLFGGYETAGRKVLKRQNY